MNLKSIMLALAITCFGVLVSFETASAGYAKSSQMQFPKVIKYTGCGLQGKIAKQMTNHPERWGKPSASLLAQYPEPQKK
jgi:hypothetical protein